MAPPAAAQQHRIFSELQAVFPHSTPGPVTSTPGGDYVFVAEAGALAVLDATLGQSGFEDELKLESISSQGVRAVELLLDPDAVLDEEDPPSAEALLYVAGGRLGLWAVELDLRQGYPMRATRIDAGYFQGVTGRTWCNSLELVEIDSDLYLAALFGRQECSRLRLYPLDDVRELFDTTLTTYAETGNELTPAADVGVGGNCLIQTPRYGSFGYGMAVDGETIYVAMGVYGLVRVAFTTITTYSATAGPYFGTGSYYAHSVYGAYDDFEFRLPDPTDETLFVVTRQDPPQFVDVVVQDGAGEHLLWAAVDHLGVVAFDLTDTWSTTMDIFHQEGKWVASAEDVDTHIQLVGDPDTDLVSTHAHRLALVEVSDGESSDLVLAVGTNSRPLIQTDSIFDEGRVVGHLGLGYQGTSTTGDTTTSLQWTHAEVEDAEKEQYEPPDTIHEYTIFYVLGDLDPEAPTLATKTYQYAKFLRQGGRHLFLPSEPPDENLLVLGGHIHAKPGTTPSLTFLARYDWPFTGDPEDQPGSSDFLGRDMQDRLGWHSYDVSYSPTTPETLYMGSTDGGCLPAGIMAHCGSSFVSFVDTTVTTDTRGTFGTVYDPQAVWVAPDETVTIGEQDVDQGRDFVFGAGRPTINGQVQKAHWMLVYFDPGEDVCATTPTREPDRRKTVYAASPKDRFQFAGRGFLDTPGGHDAAFDVHVTDDQSESELTFVARNGTPAGVYVLNRGELESQLLDDTTTVDGEALDIDSTPEIYHRELVTHPEFQNAYDEADPTLTTTDPLYHFLNDNGLVGRVLTFHPELMEIVDEEEDPRWVLAVPCGAVQLPPDLDAFTANPTWEPDDEYVENYDHAMVRVFDVHDYDTVTQATETVPAYTLIAQRPQSASVRLKPFTFDGRHFLFVTNFTDSVTVWEITDLLGRGDPTVDPDDTDYDDFYLAEWVTPEAASDDLPNNAFHLDVIEEEWHDGESQRIEAYVYVAVARYGIEVLRFDPDAVAWQRLVQVGYLRTPSGMGGLRIRNDGESDPALLITEVHTGLRAYTYPE